MNLFEIAIKFKARSASCRQYNYPLGFMKIGHFIQKLKVVNMHVHMLRKKSHNPILKHLLMVAIY
jgi:hypothetical protein